LTVREFLAILGQIDTIDLRPCPCCWSQAA